MRILLGLVIVFFLCGCFAIVDAPDEVRAFGLRKDDVLDTLERMDEKQEEDKYQIWPLGKKTDESPQEEN